MRHSLAFGLVFFGLQIPSPAQNGHSLPQDWSHSHTIFPAASSVKQQAQIGQDVRYRLQHLRRSYQQFSLEAPVRSIAGSFPADWSEAISDSPYKEGLAYPAKFSFDVSNPTPNCANDYVVYAVNKGDPARFNVIAFNNLYVNAASNGICPGTTPTVLFAYNVSRNSGGLGTAPVLSLDGSEIAMIETSSSAQLHVLKWRAGDKSGTFPAPFNSKALPDCATNGAVAPCEYSVGFSKGAASRSMPYVDYASDTAWVSDDKGNVSAISPVFTATPANPPRVLTGYPVQVGSGKMTAPIFDSVSRNVFVADTTNLYYLRTSPSSAGECASGAPPCAGKNSQPVSSGPNSGTELDPPIVDSTDGWVFAFGWDGRYRGVTIVQSDTTLSNVNRAFVSGSGGSGVTDVHSGIFDNAYYSNPLSGKLFACGENGSGHFGALYAVLFTSGGMMPGSPAFGPLNLTTSSVPDTSSVCSPLTEAYNQTAGKDFLFTGVTADCAFGASSQGCLFAFDITTSFPSAPVTNYSTPGGSSGIIIDNVTGSLTSATSLYFLTADPPGGGAGAGSPCTVYTGGTSQKGNCAVRLTQPGLN